ncbi:MAG: hypothetical protein QM628_00290 [Propionicimonas sp.]
MVTVNEIQTEVGRTLDSFEVAQATLWIESTRTVISHGRDGRSHIDLDSLDQATLEMVIREAVADRIKHPDAAKQVSISVDDGQVSRTYEASSGRIQIRDEWWDMLLPTKTAGAFTIDMRPRRRGHRDR